MNAQKLSTYLKETGEPGYRIGQVLKAIYSGVSSYDDITALPRSLRQELSAKVPMLSFTPDTVQVSKDGLAHKARLRLHDYDDKMIETVFMQPKPGYWSVCVSSQVGCPLKCSFCATGTMGYLRNLKPEEICDQVLFWKQYLSRTNKTDAISNVVYMGMGEPFLNFDAVRTSIEMLTDIDYFGFSRRSISVSTAGIIPGIDRFTNELKQVNLAISLHAANNTLRAKLAPINKAYPLEMLVKSLRHYFVKNHRKVFLEYVLLKDENDKISHAKELMEFMSQVGSERLLHVNLIVWNPTDTNHAPATRESAVKFRDYLSDNGVHVTIRKNLGLDIAGACGQLAVK